MSAICGIVALAGPGPKRAEIEALTAHLQRRGPDGTNDMVADRVALGHCLLATTPASLVETLPHRDPASGCTITADVRLDNRDELFTALGINTAAENIGDGQLILAAYLRWGDQCPARLLGDFAFAIWDPRTMHLFAARDQVGMRQFIYRHSGSRLTFATDATAIVGTATGKVALNPDRIADYLGNMEGADLSATFFDGVFRLPPAHSLKVDVTGVALHRYWQPSLEPTLDLPSDGAYADAFLKVFTEAVRCRLPSTGRLGAMLSGGIDSNSVVAVATGLLKGSPPLATFSAIGPDPAACRETRAIRDAMKSPGVSPTTVDFADLGDLHADLVAATAASGEPFDGDMALIRAVYLAARRVGVNVMLDGVASDTLLASDFHTAFLLRAGRWRSAWREARGERRQWGRRAPLWRTLAAAAWQGWAPIGWRAIRFKSGRRAANRAFAAAASVTAPGLDLDRAMARRRQVQRHAFEHDRLDATSRLRTVLHPNVIVARERYDRVAGALGIEPRDPFLDLRLIRFCLALPRDQLQRHGWPKWILRKAMAGILPAALVWKRGRDHLGPQFAAAIHDALMPALSSQPAVNHKSFNRVESLYLFRWFAAMDRQGWKSGTVTTRGFCDDDQC